MSIGQMSFVIKNDNTLYGTGRNTDGQLGLGDVTKVVNFTKIDVSDIQKINAGTAHAVILKKDGTVWTTGYNYYGQLGLSDSGAGTDRKIFTKVDVEDVKDIYCGNENTFALKKDGTVWATGYNSQGQLGLGDANARNIFTKIDIDNIKQIACGSSHTLVLKKDGTVWATGYNNQGQLGLGTSGAGTDRKIFTKVDISGVKFIFANGHTSWILKKDGTVWATGDNYYGQFGLGTNGSANNKSVFTKVDIDDVKIISVGMYHTFVLKKDGAVWATGYNKNGQLGLGDSGTDRKIFEKVDIDNVKQINCNNEHTMILKNDGTLWMAGKNDYGQLGLDGNADRNVFTKVDIDDVKDIMGIDKEVFKVIKHLIKNNQKYVTVNESGLYEIDESVLSKELFMNNGMSDINLLLNQISEKHVEKELIDVDVLDTGKIKKNIIRKSEHRDIKEIIIIDSK